MDFKTCPKCTESVQSDVNFCPKCGHNFTLNHAAPSALEAGVGTAQAVVAVLLIIFGLLGALYTCS